MADAWRTPDVDALLDASSASRTATRPRASCATCARSTSSATWPSAGPSPACSTTACTTPQISRETGASTATITRIASWLNHGEGGYREALERLDAAREAGIPYPVRRASR